MVQAAESLHGYDLAACIGILFCFTTGRRSFVQCKVRSVVVIVADVLIHEALQIPFVEHDHVVEQIAATGTHPTLGNAVLPRTAEAGSFRLGAEVFHRVDDFLIEVCAAIEDQVFRSRVVRECLA